MLEISAEADAALGAGLGRLLAARLSSFATGNYSAEVTGHCTCSQGAMVFRGRPDGKEHALCLSTSSRARILAHWEIYVRPAGEAKP